MCIFDMNQYKRSWYIKLVSCFVVCLLFAIAIFPGQTEARDVEFRIMFDGEVIPFQDAKPYLNRDNRTMVPLRFVSENLNATVSWNAFDQSVTIKKDQTTILLTVNSRTIIVNGSSYNMDTEMVYSPAYQRNYVPLRFVSEYLGSDVDYHWTSSGVLAIQLTSEDYHPYQHTISPDNTKRQESTPLPETPPLASIIIPGSSEEDVLDELGSPERKEVHRLGYEWWIYNEPLHEYIQVAVSEGEVTEVFTLSDRFDYGGLTVGDSFNRVLEKYPREPAIHVEGNRVTYTMNNTAGETVESYYVRDRDYIVRFYFDIHDNNRLTGIRLMNDETFVKTSSLGFTYSFFSDAEFIHETDELPKFQQNQISRANERIMFDIMNFKRQKHRLELFTLRKDISEVAYYHSNEMRTKDFFSHQSPYTGQPWDRMERAGLSAFVYENIARGFGDAINANAGLMNSEGHRKALLDPTLKEVGIGVSGLFYTQKFIR